MARSVTPSILLAVLAVGASPACALRRQPPAFMDAVLEYPRPDQEQRGVISADTALLPTDEAFHTYTVTVALAGFLPEARPLQLRAGCTEHVVVVLRVASTEALEVLKANRKQWARRQSTR